MTTDTCCKYYNFNRLKPFTFALTFITKPSPRDKAAKPGVKKKKPSPKLGLGKPQFLCLDLNKIGYSEARIEN